MPVNPQTKALPAPDAGKLQESAMDLYRALEELADMARMQIDKIPEQATWRIDDRALSRADTALAKARAQVKDEPKYNPTGASATGAYDASGQLLRSPEDKASTEQGGNQQLPPRPDDTSGSAAGSDTGTAMSPGDGNATSGTKPAP